MRPVDEIEIEHLIAHAAYALGFGAPEHEVIQDLQDDYEVDLEQAYLATRAAGLLRRVPAERRRSA